MAEPDERIARLTELVQEVVDQAIADGVDPDEVEFQLDRRDQ